MADPAMRELYKQWYPLDPVPEALGKIGQLVTARKEMHAVSYAEIQLQSAHDRIAELEEALRDMLEVADRERKGYALPAEEWYAHRDAAQALLPPLTGSVEADERGEDRPQ